MKKKHSDTTAEEKFYGKTISASKRVEKKMPTGLGMEASGVSIKTWRHGPKRVGVPKHVMKNFEKELGQGIKPAFVTPTGWVFRPKI